MSKEVKRVKIDGICFNATHYLSMGKSKAVEALVRDHQGLFDEKKAAGYYEVMRSGNASKEQKEQEQPQVSPGK